MRLALLLLLAVLLDAKIALAWDPIGDLKNPGRIIENVGRETGNAVRDAPNVPRNIARETSRGIQDIPNIPRNIGRELENVGREIDRVRREIDVHAAAPIFEQWLWASRNSARPTSQPIPPGVRAAMQGIFPEHILSNASYKIGDAGVFNIAHLSIRYGDVAAAVLIDTIVFAQPENINDLELWAHELRHVQQFSEWGVRDFSIRYLRSWNGVEGDATQTASRWASGQHVAQSGQPPPPVFPGPPPMMGMQCFVTPMNWCPMPGRFPQGASCACAGPYGPIYGAVR